MNLKKSLKNGIINSDLKQIFALKKEVIQMIEIVGRPEYVPSESAKVFTGDQINSYKAAGYLLVREGRWEGDPTIMGKPSQVLVTYKWKGDEKTADLKGEIQKAYNRYYRARGKKNIRTFTENTFKMFLKDLDLGRIIALPNKFEGADIWFKVL
jgi:hypothetical protein